MMINSYRIIKLLIPKAEAEDEIIIKQETKNQSHLISQKLNATNVIGMVIIVPNVGQNYIKKRVENQIL